MLARTHIERDAAKVFEAVVTAMAAQQQEVARNGGANADGSPAPAPAPHHDEAEVAGSDGET
jgi:hypothetical protein